jgi:FkbM family methyltransferase
MLIPLSEMISRHSLAITGVLHVGAHEAEENDAYLAAGIPQHTIYWVDAIPDLCNRLRARLPNIINAAVSDTAAPAEFHVTNNVQSSSLLPLKTHLVEHPTVYVVRTVQTTTQLLDNVVEQYRIRVNFLNLDIQGAELKCLKGFEKSLHMIDYIYAEVNERELYAGCALLPEMDAWLSAHGFDRVDTSMTTHGWGDALYVRRK